MQGWIKLYRKFEDHWLWKERRVLSKAEAWIDIIWQVNHKYKKALIKNNLIDCDRGQSINSLETWQKRWNWRSKKSVRDFLKLLQKDNMIGYENLTVTIRLTVCNYESYQVNGNGEETQNKRIVNAEETQRKPNKNVKNVKNDINTIFDHWNEQKITVHRRLTEKIKRKINGSLRDYSLEEIKTAINNYSSILKSNDYYWTHKWTLEEFLQRGLEKFLDWEIAKNNYLNKKKEELNPYEMM